MESEKNEEKFLRCKLEKIMKKKGLPLIEKNASVKRVLAELTKRTHVWVTDGKRSRKVVGVITEHDVLTILSPRRPAHIIGIPNMRTLHGKAEEVMTKGTISCTPDETVGGALNKMATHGVRRLPVVDRNGNILGEVTLHQIIKKFSATKGGNETS